VPSALLLRRLTIGAGLLVVAAAAGPGLTTVPAQATEGQRHAPASQHTAVLVDHSARLRLRPLLRDPLLRIPPTGHETTGHKKTGHKKRARHKKHQTYLMSRVRAAAAPKVSALVPAQGAPGWTVLLSGTGFRHISSVRFAGGARASFRIINAGELSTVVPAGASNGPVTVTSTAGSGQSAVFTVTPAQTLEPGETMAPGQSLSSRDGHYTLTMQANGNLVYYVTGSLQTLWFSGTAGHAGAYLTMLNNGNLVIYDKTGAKTLWSTGTSGHGPADLQAQDNGALVLYDGSAHTWSSGSFDNELASGQTLRSGWYLTSGSGYLLSMRRTGDLVESNAKGATVWQSGTAGHAGATATMRTNGNLVVSNGTTLWSSGTSGHSGARLALQSNGAVAVHGQGKVLWASQKTSSAGPLTMGQWPGKAGPPAAAKYYDYPYPAAPACTHKGACDADKWDFYEGQCTSWVAFQINRHDGLDFTNYYGGQGRWGDAVDWAARAKSLKLAVNTTPAVGSVAWYAATKAAPGGHVAFVERVLSPTSIVISEMNYDGDNGFWVHTITASGTDWPSDFIHLTGH
jgi:surface antigen